jgi:hypothetical protein
MDRTDTRRRHTKLLDTFIFLCYINVSGKLREGNVRVAVRQGMNIKKSGKRFEL